MTRYMAKFDDPTVTGTACRRTPGNPRRRAWRRDGSFVAWGCARVGTTRLRRSCGAAGVATGLATSTASTKPARSARRRRPSWPLSLKLSKLVAPARPAARSAPTTYRRPWVSACTAPTHTCT